MIDNYEGLYGDSSVYNKHGDTFLHRYETTTGLSGEKNMRIETAASNKEMRFVCFLKQAWDSQGGQTSMPHQHCRESPLLKEASKCFCSTSKASSARKVCHLKGHYVFIVTLWSSSVDFLQIIYRK